MSDELEDLTDGVSGSFWHHVSTHMEDEWGDVGYAKKITSVLAVPDVTLKLSQLEQLAAIRKEVMRLKAWPATRIRTLQNTQDAPATRAEVNQHLRELDLALAGRPRRGGL